MSLNRSVEGVHRPIMLLTALAVAGALVALMPAVAGAQTAAPAAKPAAAKPAAAKPAAKPAPLQTAKASVRKPAVAMASEPMLAAASPAQVEAAKEVMLGRSACEFNQSIKLDENTRHPGYVDLSFNNKVYTMKPVMSATGALRLEDVRSEALLIQIGSKTMLMNQKTGQRMVDNCVHAKQQQYAASGTRGHSIGIEPTPAK